jgi:hypothetical protein
MLGVWFILAKCLNFTDADYWGGADFFAALIRATPFRVGKMPARADQSL